MDRTVHNLTKRVHVSIGCDHTNDKTYTQKPHRPEILRLQSEGYDYNLRTTTLLRCSLGNLLALYLFFYKKAFKNIDSNVNEPTEVTIFTVSEYCHSCPHFFSG